VVRFFERVSENEFTAEATEQQELGSNDFVLSGFRDQLTCGQRCEVRNY